MNLKKVIGLAVTTLALNMSIMGDVYAGIDVKCAGGVSRSKASVDGRSLANAKYIASVKSGTAAEKFSKNSQRPVAGEVEFDFDSNPADVKAGATAIPATFIKNHSVLGKIYRLNANGTKTAVAAELNDACKAK